MNVLFLTLLDFESINEHNIYTDLLREFVKRNHNVYIISPVEKRTGKNTSLIKESHSTILKLKIGNVQKTNIIEKGISTVLLERVFITGIKKYFSTVKFDLIMYSTPPITLQNAVRYVKKRDGAKTYLLLKDIFPQNAVDMGMLSKHGIKGILYRYFRHKEKKLYALSDRIGCMSPANVDFVLKNNPDVDSGIVEVCPNCIEVVDIRIDQKTRDGIRDKYGIPKDKTVFVYGGNLGKPQGIDFLIKCLKSQMKNKQVFFLIVGDGTEFNKLNEFIKKVQPFNVKLLKRIPKDDYDCMVAACDVGMIFLDYRFTIPNFPSRMLSYMQAGLPILACTDKNTDVGQVIADGRFGWWCESNNVKEFYILIKSILESDLSQIGARSFAYLNQNYSTDIVFKTLEKIYLNNRKHSYNIRKEVKV